MPVWRVWWISVCPEGFRSESQAQFCFWISCSCSMFLSPTWKDLDAMFIPFAHDPDLGSTATSFHTRIRIWIDLQDRPRLARVNQRPQVNVLHLCLKKPTACIIGWWETWFNSNLHVKDLGILFDIMISVHQHCGMTIKYAQKQSVDPLH